MGRSRPELNGDQRFRKPSTLELLLSICAYVFVVASKVVSTGCRVYGLVMKLFEQQDDKGIRRRSRTSKLMRRMKHKRERRAAKENPEHAPTYNRFKGYVL